MSLQKARICISTGRTVISMSLLKARLHQHWPYRNLDVSTAGKTASAQSEACSQRCRFSFVSMTLLVINGRLGRYRLYKTSRPRLEDLAARGGDRCTGSGNRKLGTAIQPRADNKVHNMQKITKIYIDMFCNMQCNIKVEFV